MLEKLILKYGLPKLIGAALVLLVVAVYGGKLAWAEGKAWYYEGKAERRTEQRDVARAQAKVARQDEKQVTGAAAITADTVAAQDAHAESTRAATTHASEVIHERIRQAPVAPAAVVADDPVVRDAVAQARARAQAAADRLRGASPR